MRNQITSKQFACGILLCLCALIPTALQGKGNQSIPTLYVSADGGMSTYKSKLVASNDTSTATRYSMGLYAGLDKVIGFAIRTDSQSTNFELNDSTVTMSWQETFLKYRIGNLSTGAIISLATMTAESTANSQSFDLTGSGYGAFIHYFYPFGRLGKLNLEVDSVTISSIQESNQVDVTLGQRLDIDFGASFSLTKKDLLELVVGYRTRSFSVTTNSSYAEQIATTYLGLSTVFLF